MARVKYNKLFPLVITSDDMGKTELTNNWAAFNGYPVHTATASYPTGDDYLASPYSASLNNGESDVNNYTPLTFTDDVGKTHRFAATSAIWPQNADNNNYSLMNATDAKTMLRTGWSFAQHDVDDATDIATIASRFGPLSSAWATATGSAGLKVMVEPGGNHNYIAAGINSSEICWNIFQNATTTYPNLSLSLNDWAATRTDWTTPNSPSTEYTTFNSKPQGANERYFFQGKESTWTSTLTDALSNNQGSNIVLGGTHGIATSVTDYLKNTLMPANKAWVASADEVWEYYHLYNNVKIGEATFDGSNLTFDVQIPTYNKSMFREVTINIPGLMGGPTSTDGTVTTSGATVVTGGYKQNDNQFTINLGLESRTLDYIDELITLYRTDPSNLFVKRDAQYLIDLLWPGTTKTAKQAALNATFNYSYRVVARLYSDNTKTTLVGTKTLKSGYSDASSTEYYNFSRYILNDGKLYKTTGNSLAKSNNDITAWCYRNQYDVDDKDKVFYIDYVQEKDNAVFFSEMENIENISSSGITVYSYGCTNYANYNDQAGRYVGYSSGCGGIKIDYNTTTVLTTLPAGTYNIYMGVVGSAQNESNDNYYQFKAGSTALGSNITASDVADKLNEYSTGDFTLTSSQDITLYHSSTQRLSVDYIYIVQTAALPPTVTLTPSQTTNVWTNTELTLNATATLNGNSALTSILFEYSTDNGTNWTEIATVTDDLQSGISKLQTFTPPSAGDYIFRATATDNGSLTDGSGNGLSTSATTSSITVTTVPESYQDIMTSTSSIEAESGVVTVTASVRIAEGETISGLVIQQQDGESWTTINTNSYSGSGRDYSVSYIFTPDATGTLTFRALATVNSGERTSSTTSITVTAPAAKTATFIVQNTDSQPSATVSNVAYGADLATNLPSTLKRKYCDYEFYSDALLTNQLTTFNHDAYTSGTVYVKWKYCDDAPVFSTGTDPEKFQYYTVYNNNGALYQYYTAGTSKFENSTTVPAATQTHYHWAFVGNPYELKIYNRVGGYIATIASDQLKNSGTITATANAAEAQIWELTDYSRTNPLFRVKGQTTNYHWWKAAIYINEQNSCEKILKHIIVPLKVYDSANSMAVVTDKEYQLDYPGTSEKLMLSLMESSSYGNYTYKHKYCTYTPYLTNNNGTLSDEIPSEGVSIYGGAAQTHKAIYATYVVNSNHFVMPNSADIYWYALKNSNNMQATANTTTVGNTLLQTYNAINTNKEYQWAFIGTPYSCRLVNCYTGSSKNAATSSTTNGSIVYLTDNATTYPYGAWELFDPDSSDDTKVIIRQKDNTTEPNMASGFYSNQVYVETPTSTSYTYTLVQLDHTTSNATLTITASASPYYVDQGMTLTATATPAAGKEVTALSIERLDNGNWVTVGTAYAGSNISGVAEKDAETGVVTLTVPFTPTTATTYQFRAKATASGETVLSTETADPLSITVNPYELVVRSDNYKLRLVDKAGTILFSEDDVDATRVSSPNEKSGLTGDPIDKSWRSPLVTRYYYYKTLEAARENTKASADLFDWSSEETTPTVYVGYEVSDAIDLNAGKFTSLNDGDENGNSLMKNRVTRTGTTTKVRDASKFGKMYLLKFKTSAVYHQENGSDKVETAEVPIGETVYPYTNGDGPMYIYTDARYQDQKYNGASTRTRWPWYLVSLNGDPYHVYVTSWQNSHANNGTNQYSYLRTFYVDSTIGVVTNNVTDDNRTVDGNTQLLPTEYMLLGANDDNGTYRLTTVDEINGSRQTVTSLEQYWRNNPTAQIAAGRTLNDKGELENENKSTLTSTEETTLEGKGWHKYETWVNAADWTGETGSKYRRYVKENHWYQSIQLGEGSFDLVEADIDGVLVLLDNHGWEIMRKPIVAKDDPDYETVKDALRKYDSPMVKEYKFYSTRNVDHKVYGYHKYDIVNNTGSNTPLAASTRVDADKTITSLADYEPHTSGGALTDLYVTYDVKDEYKNSYDASSKTVANVYIRQGGNYAKASGSSIEPATLDANDNTMQWNVKPNLNIDTEMGYLYNNGTGNSELTESALNQKYADYGWDGFDPYNLQIQNVNTQAYFTVSDATEASLSTGAWTGDGSSVALTNATLTFDADSYDGRTCKVTNATFMAVQDANGNMRLMPRFNHDKVLQGFTALDEQADDQPAGNTTHAQTTLLSAPEKTYHIIDNSGADVFGGITSTGIGLAVPTEYQSPGVEAYYYHSTKDDAKTNRTTSDVNISTAGTTVYVSYSVKSDFSNDKAIISSSCSNQYLHMNYDATATNTNNLYRTYQQTYDHWSSDYYDTGLMSRTAMDATNYPFIDNNFVWQLGTDPYSIKIKNKASGRFISNPGTSDGNGYNTHTDTEDQAVTYSLLYWNGTQGTDYSLRQNSGSNFYISVNTGSNGYWQGNANGSKNEAKLNVIDLSDKEVAIHVHKSGSSDDEVVLQAYYIAGTSMHTFTPYYLWRSCTSNHQFYYDSDCESNIAYSTAIDETNLVKTDGKYNVYVTYTLSDDWNLSTTDAFSAKLKPFISGNINWFALQSDNYRKNLAVNESGTSSEGNDNALSTVAASSNSDNTKQQHWAFVGTPYNLKIANRFYGLNEWLGANSDAVSGDNLHMMSEGSGYVTWEVLAYQSNSISEPTFFFRLQKAYNGEAPYLCMANVPTSATEHDMELASYACGYGFKAREIESTSALSVSFQLYDKSGTSVGLETRTVIGVSAGDKLLNHLQSTDLVRRYCDYTFYTDNTFETTETVATSEQTQTYYVKWDYSADAPVFSQEGGDTRDYQYYMISVFNGTYDFMMDVEGNTTNGYTLAPSSTHTTLKEGHTQFALVGNPYAFKLYSRYADTNLKTNSSGAGLTFLATVDEVATTDAVFDLPIPVNDNITQPTQMDIRMKAHPERHIYCNTNEFWMNTSTGGFAQLMYIVVPVRVFKEGSTALANIVDYQEYALELNPNGTARATDARMTDSDLYRSTDTSSPNYHTKDFRHAFCDYTFYHTYDWSTGALSNAIPSTGNYAGLPYYGGSTNQFARSFFATYTVDEEQFSTIYLLDNANDNGKVFFGSNAKSTSGDNVYYTLKCEETTLAGARNDDTNAYRWLMTGDPYNLQLTCLGTGDDYQDIPLGVTNFSITNAIPTVAAGTLARLTNDVTYAAKSHWEVVLNSTGNHIFFLTDDVTTYDDADRYTYSLGQQTYTSANLFASSDKLYVLHLTPAVPQYDVVWKVMEGSDVVASYTKKNVSQGTTLTLADMPEVLRRHFCEYNNMYSDQTCTTAYTGNKATVGNADMNIYVPYTLAAGAPTFYESVAAYTGTAGADQDPYLVRLNQTYYVKSTDGATAVTETVKTQAASGSVGKWVLIGTPYKVQFYNLAQSKYLYINQSSISPGATIPVGTGSGEGDNSYWTLLDDKTGDRTAICMWEIDNHQLLYVGYDNSGNVVMNILSDKALATSAEFVGENGIDGIKMCLHYGANTLRKNSSGTSMASQTETFTIYDYFNKGTKLIDVMPAIMKRAFCSYTFQYDGTDVTEDDVKDIITNALVNAAKDDTKKDDDGYITVDVYYTVNSPFKWSTNNNNDYTGKYWYYLVNNHVPAGSGEEGRMVYRDSDPKLRVSEALVQNKLYLNNYEWCVIGDPYGFKMLNRYDPDHKFNEYISVMTYNDSHNDGLQLEQQANNANHIFEMMPGLYSYNFWMHPVYTSELRSELTADACSYVGNNYNGSAAIIPTTKKSISYLHTNNAANFRLEIQSNATLAEYVKYAGFVGGLKYDAITDDDLRTAAASSTLTDEQKKAVRTLIDDPENIVQMKQGYYRLIPYTWEKNNNERRYVQGYLDNAELTSNGGQPNNLHIETSALAEYDPASIFWFNYTEEAVTNYPRYYVKTQGLSLTGNGLGTGEGFECRYEDIGAGIMQLKSQSENNDRHYDYLSCAGGNETSTNHCFDEQNGLYKTRFYLQPVGTGGNELPFKMKMNKGHDGFSDSPVIDANSWLKALPYTYTSIYVPYDIEVAGGKDVSGNTVDADKCDLVPFWGSHENYHPNYSKVSDTYYNQGEYALICKSLDMHKSAPKGNKVIPAGTPVIFRSLSGMQEITFKIPDDAPKATESPIDNNVLSGYYLNTTDDNTQIRVFGKEEYYDEDDLKWYSTGRVGFFPRSYENGKYYDVPHNKAYYSQINRNSSGSRKGIFFEFNEDEETGISEQLPSDPLPDETIYDLQGRKVERIYRSGVYIVNGHKVIVKKERR